MGAEKSLTEVETEIVDEFSMFDEWLDKYEYLIELGKSLKGYPEEKKTDDHLIKGCQSRVWLDWKYEEGRLWFNADSDAIITGFFHRIAVHHFSKYCNGFIYRCSGESAVCGIWEAISEILGKTVCGKYPFVCFLEFCPNTGLCSVGFV